MIRKPNTYNIKTDTRTQYLYTKGSEFSLDGANYVGEYHILGDQAFTEPIPNQHSKKLTKFYKNQDLYAYDKSRAFKERKRVDRNKIVFKPVDADYESGYATRYFVERAGKFEGYPLEIDEKQAESFGKSGGIDEGVYNIVTLKWKLIGLERTTRLNNHTEFEGIYDHNLREVILASKVIPNLINAIKNYTEFARITLVAF